VTAYDEVPYTGHPYADSHPERLATMATLFGMKPAPVERCRVLEIACGDAANLVPIAYALPSSTFVGFDLAAQPIEIGQRMVARLGLTNIALAQRDLADFPADAGEFDYIIAHGLYSWIPAGARDRLLALVARHLTPRGVAFVSYNVYPGCYIRRMVWEMLRFHTDPLGAPAERIAEAQGLARLLADGRTVHDPYSALMKTELERFTARDAGFLIHDDLAEVNEPVYFHEFVAHAGKQRLQFLCEAELVAMAYGGLTLDAKRALDALDPLAREQYLDFVKCRRFRQTLLCHEDVRIERQLGPEKVAAFRLSARRRVQVDDSAAAEPPLGDDAPAQAILDALDDAAPGALTLDELAARVPGSNEDFLRRLTWAAACAGAVQLHVHVPRLATAPGERPVASAVARAQLEHGESVTSLRHDAVKLDDELVRRLLPLLDGTRALPALAAALGEAPEAIEARLRHLAKLALLVG
jgi:methyltransferase-like protein/ubiquinone/menaquinone biosynthesis C-methylase UbiE